MRLAPDSQWRKVVMQRRLASLLDELFEKAGVFYRHVLELVMRGGHRLDPCVGNHEVGRSGQDSAVDSMAGIAPGQLPLTFDSCPIRCKTLHIDT